MLASGRLERPGAGFLVCFLVVPGFLFWVVFLVNGFPFQIGLPFIIIARLWLMIRRVVIFLFF